MTLALTAPTRTNIVPAVAQSRWSPRSRLRLWRRWLRRARLEWRFMGRDRRLLEDIGVARGPDRAIPADFLCRFSASRAGKLLD